MSRSIGYTDNGRSLIVDTGGDVVELRHLRLTADRWPGADVRVDGLDPCLAWFQPFLRA